MHTTMGIRKLEFEISVPFIIWMSTVFVQILSITQEPPDRFSKNFD